ncbi:MAG TPA: DUF1080 domain-containing protein [Bacteroidales bacterium]|jgi:hypothetical protein|nr:DUF1080 domain-containing protein [Bacteroidales bacterium]
MKSGVYTLVFALSLSVQMLYSQHECCSHQQQGCAPQLITSLFNGHDLSSWEFVLKDQSVDPSTVFTVKNAAVHITGNPFGYMRTKETFKNYKLHLEFSWPAEVTNSGVFIHAQKPDGIWPTCFEVQLMGGNAGDFICMGKSDMAERIDKSNIVVKKYTASNEVPAGEWNTLEVICKDNTIEVFVNGTLQNKASGTNLSDGHICLQSEGKDIEFRNIYVSKL